MSDEAEKKDKPTPCTRDQLCWVLRDRVVMHGRGLRRIEGLDLNSKVGHPTTKLLGVAYAASAKDRGLLLNFCPWCGGKPGEMVNRDVPKPAEPAPEGDAPHA